jgi:hypothetical protein
MIPESFRQRRAAMPITHARPRVGAKDWLLGSTWPKLAILNFNLSILYRQVLIRYHFANFQDYGIFAQ